jgi:nucleotide-binding universal stress UspA family protein
MTSPQRILVPTDGSAGAEAAGDLAAGLVRALAASVDVVTVVDTGLLQETYSDVSYCAERVGAVRDAARTTALRFARRHFEGIADVQVLVRDGYPFLEILQVARDLGSDLIVMGTHGRTGIAHLIIGSVAEKIVRSSRVPVLTVRAAV